MVWGDVFNLFIGVASHVQVRLLDQLRPLEDVDPLSFTGTVYREPTLI